MPVRRLSVLGLRPISDLKRPFLTCCALLVLTACATGPDYVQPDAAGLGLPPAYSSGPYAGTGTVPDEALLARWWLQYNDPLLSAWVDRGRAANLDMAQAAARLRQARESLVQARAAGLPGASLSASGGRNFGDGASSSFSVGADASWQLDLFGAISRSVEAGRADLAAAGYSLADVQSAITALIVTNYIDLRLTQERLRIARESLERAQDNADIARWRVEAGLVSSLDSEQARAQLAQQAATIPQLERSLAGTLNRLAVLTGEAPGIAARPLEAAAPIPTPPAATAIGVPFDVLRQRPDVRASERALAAATARIGVARSALYPSLGLAGNIGSAALSVGSLFDSVSSGLFVRLGQLIFDGGATRSRVRSQEAAAEGALAAYRSSVLTAVEDVENALAYDRASRARSEQLAIALDAASNSAILARSQYRAGLIDFQILLTSEQTLLNARDGLAAARADEALAVATVYSALGGGWQDMDGQTG